MKKRILTFLIVAASITTLRAQNFQSNINGVTAQTKDLSSIAGSAYSSEKWLKGDVALSDGKAYNNLELKYSEYEDDVFFKGNEEQMMNFAEGVKQFTLKQEDGTVSTYRKGYTNVPGTDAKSYFEVIADGKTQLLRKTSKKVREEVVYPSTTPSKSFQKTVRYYIVTPEKVTLVKADKKSILASLNTKQAELESFIKSNNIDFKKDKDLSALITYYNSL